jgi:hypothetical protein
MVAFFRFSRKKTAVCGFPENKADIPGKARFSAGNTAFFPSPAFPYI